MAAQGKRTPIQDFPVNKEYGENENFFRVITPDGEVHLPKFKFQKDQPLPDTISCRIKENQNGRPILAHNFMRYINEFYADGFSKGQSFNFRVTHCANDAKTDYFLQDEYGLQFRITNQKTPLSVGQIVKCRFETLNPVMYRLRRSESDTQLRSSNLREIGRFLSLKSWEVDKLERTLQEIPEMKEPMQEHANGEPVWILHALRAVHLILPRWFNQAVATMSASSVHYVLESCSKITLNLLQGSDFLRFIKGDERTELQAELTSQIEEFDIYLRALDIIEKKGQREFIDVLLAHLKNSGYLYHPNIQFAILMILFRQSPDLVNSSLGNIFDTLMEWYPSTWKAEPFRQAFVDQLQIYITDARDEIEQFLLPETSEDNEKIEKVLTAIAIQQSLATDQDRVDILKNMSLFYRCLSLLHSTKADVLLQKSYLTLMGVKLPTDFTWLDIKEPTMMMTRAAVDPPANVTLPDSAKYYINDKIELKVGPDGITISHADYNSEAQIPGNEMLTWPGLQVRVPVEHQMNRTRLRNLDRHVEFWNDVEKSLFMPQTMAEQFTQSKRQPDPDDLVEIEITRIILSATDMNKAEAFVCKIVDENYIEAEGIMAAEDLVSYHLYGIKSGAFLDDSGNSMRFKATVDSIDENDVAHFSLIGATRGAVRDVISEGETCLAVITKINERNYSAISDRGFGLFVHRNPDNNIPYHTRDVVKVEVTSIDPYNYVQGKAIEGPLYGVTIDNTKSLRTLLSAIAINNDYIDEISIDEDEMIPAEDIREIVDVLRFKAISLSDNIIHAFDYLSYARLLARIIGDQDMARRLKAHKEMLLLSQQYAKNKSIYREDIENVTNSVPDDILISRMSNKLNIVASLTHSEENPRLWEIVNGDANEIEKELAQMALTHNLIYDLNHEDPCLDIVKDNIAKTLNVSNEQRNLKYYGSESQYIEFKSSLVYPAQKGRKGLSMADPDRQEFEILHIIAGFLNTTGGTLYIGVADDHYERGLEEDFKFYRMDTSDRNTPYRRKIRSLDNLATYLQSLIDKSFNLGKTIGDYAKTSVDDEASKGVIMVKVAPCPHIVTLDSKIFVRHGSSTVPLLTTDEIDRFKNDRERLFEEQAKVQNEDANEEAAGDANTITAEAEAQDSKHADIAQQTEQTADVEDTLALYNPDGLNTSHTRNNILHDYEDYEHFVPAHAYLRFTKDQQLIATKDEWSLEEDDLAHIIVHDDEADQALLLVYEDDSAMKVPMDRLLDKDKMNSPQKLFGDKRLVFATPIHAADGVYSIHTNSKGTVYERVTPASDFAVGNVNSVPSRFITSDADTSPFYELVPAARMTDFSTILSSAFRRNQLGSLAKGPANAKVLPEYVIKKFYDNFNA